jgi:hypothetical protein
VKAAVDREALAIAMAVVPGLCSRNKHFALYGDPDVRRARARASLLRGVVRQLSGAHGKVDHVALARGAHGCELRFSIHAMHLERRVALSDLEAACVAYLASRSGIPHVHATDDDRAKVEAALKRMAPVDFSEAMDRQDAKSPRLIFD